MVCKSKYYYTAQKLNQAEFSLVKKKIKNLRLAPFPLEKIPPSESLFLIVKFENNLKWVKEIQATWARSQHRQTFFILMLEKPQAIAALKTLFFDDFFLKSDPSSTILARLHRLERAQDQSDSLEKKEVLKKEIVLKQREEFLGVCAHDLRSPLGVIESGTRWLIQQLAGKKVLSALELEWLYRIEKQAQHSLALVKDLLDIVSFEQGYEPNFSLISLDTFLKEFIADFKNLADQKDINLEYINDFTTTKAVADPARLRQLLLNLYTNAIKFTDPRKRICLRVKTMFGKRDIDPPYPMVVVSVEDEGRGIPRHELQKIFDRFSQVKNSTSTDGRGLGLTVAKQISQLHEGNLWVESEEGKGTSFHLLLRYIMGERIGGFRKKPIFLWMNKNVSARWEILKNTLERYGEIVYSVDALDTLCLAHYYLPAMILFSAETRKISLTETIRLIKENEATKTTPLVYLENPDDKTVETHLFDRVLGAGYQEGDIEKLLKALHSPIALQAA